MTLYNIYYLHFEIYHTGIIANKFNIKVQYQQSGISQNTETTQYDTIIFNVHSYLFLSEVVKWS